MTNDEEAKMLTNVTLGFIRGAEAERSKDYSFLLEIIARQLAIVPVPMREEEAPVVQESDDGNYKIFYEPKRRGRKPGSKNKKRGRPKKA